MIKKDAIKPLPMTEAEESNLLYRVGSNLKPKDRLEKLLDASFDLAQGMKDQLDNPSDENAAKIGRAIAETEIYLEIFYRSYPAMRGEVNIYREQVLQELKASINP